MKRLAIVAVGVAVVGLTACSHTTAHDVPSASHSAISPTASPTAQVNCHQLYHTWEYGPGKGLIPTLHAVSVASTAGDPQTLTVALSKASSAVARAARYPMPACADPKGYWTTLMMHVTAAVASKNSAASTHAAMKDVPRIEQGLTAELKKLSP
jgi:hypothetical protein